MKALPTAVQTALDSGATTFARCWTVTLADSTVFGFTDHDATLSFGGVDHEPESGFLGTDVSARLGLAVDTQEIEGALSSGRIEAADLALGLWDDAEVTLTLVDWSDVANRVVLRKASIGEVTRGDTAFRAELRGLAHRLNQDQGRVYQRICDAVVGDARCGIDLDTSEFRGDGTVTAVVEDRTVTASGLGSFASDWFTGGKLVWATGDNAGAAVEVRQHVRAGGVTTIALRQRAAAAIAGGDTFEVFAGCGKTFATCKAKFDNVANFRGFPHMPGNDTALAVARQDDIENDGGSLFN